MVILKKIYIFYKNMKKNKYNLVKTKYNIIMFKNTFKD